jgi:formylglycine-generating enzyme required for sulfatase activity
MAQIKELGNKRWSVNSIGQTMVHLDGPLKFRMGVASNDPDYQNEVEHQRKIPRRFGIAAREVSNSQFDEFWKTHFASFDKPQFGPGSDIDLPRAGVTWYMAAAYCNWLSEKEGKQPVYARNDDGKFAEGMRCDARTFDNGGYRLPTEAEWEYACRAGTETSRYYGHSLSLLRQYARLTDWERVSLLKTGSLLPNDFGLFDMLGNVTEWCHDADYDYNALANDQSSDYIFNKVLNSRYCVMRGGSYRSRPPDAQSAVRAKYEPGVSEFTIGFRVARSLPSP